LFKTQQKPLYLINIDQVAVAKEFQFHISVTPLGEDEYLVRTERVAPGVPLAEKQVRWPVEDWLAQARQLMNDPLLGVLQGNPAFVENIFLMPEWEEPSESSLNLVALGQQLYNALFEGSLRDSWMMAQAIAQNHGQILRLRLGLKGTRLPRLPWEVLHGGDRPLATGTEVAFSRYQLGTRLRQPLHAPPAQPYQSLHAPPAQPYQPLKILMVISSPSDQENLELAQEAKHLEAELNRRSLNGSPTIDLDILEQPGREALAQALEQGQYQVFHYAGHSNLGESGGDVYLVSNKTGLTETLNGDDLAGLLVNNGVQLAVFNSCRGAYTATSEGLEQGKDRNLAEALVKRGIPAVLAMAERIPDEVAVTLTKLLYRNLNQGYPIDLSLSRAREGLIFAYGSNQLYWALPVLYLHPEFDGFLTNSNQVTQNRDDCWRVRPDPQEMPLSPNQEQGLFRPQTRLTPISFENDDEFARPSMLDWVGYEDESLDDFPDDLEPDESDADDPSTFIKSLLDQLGTESATGESALPPLGSENRPRAASEAINSDLAASASKGQPPRPRESAATNLSAGMSQASRPQVHNPAKSPEDLGPEKSGGLKSWWQKLQLVPRLWMVIGSAGIVAIALLGFWFFQNRGPKLNELPTPISQPDNWQKADTATVTNIAIKQFAQGNIPEGQKAAEKLLDDGALPQAKAALDAVPKSKLDDPAVNFLKGRLAWQSIQAGSKDYSLDDARRFWETAQKGQPNSPNYLNALGFAYYAEGNYDRANQAWWDALSQVKKETAAADVAGNSKSRETLNIYAGLALGLRQSAQKQPDAKQASLLSKSLQLGQFVMDNDPVNFQPDALSKNWLWSEKAIQDWRSLLAISKQKPKT
jgi:hypothetical protein